MRKILATTLATFLTFSAHAGMPIEDKMDCPLGGKEIKITSTASCSTMGHMMSLQAVTSCDFVTRLPQCPDSGLWVYKDFTEEELSLLPDILNSEDYKSQASKSRYYQSYAIENALPSSDPSESFFLLLSGIWYDRLDQTIDNDEYFNAYSSLIDDALSDEAINSPEFYHAGHIMFLIHRNDIKTAKTKFPSVQAMDKGENEYFTQYLSALSYCLDKPEDKELCSLNSRIRAHMEKPEE